MHVGIIRGDMPGNVLLDGLEPKSQYNPAIEPTGQEVYVSRPTTAEVEGVLADTTVGAGAIIEGGTISFNLVISGSNDVLRLKLLASDGFVNFSIAQTTYTNLADLVVAINLALGNGSGITCRANIAGDGIALESDTKGVDSRVENDTTGNGSIANSDLALANGSIRTVVPAATFITDTLPVGGPLDVSTGTMNGSGTGTASTYLTDVPAARGLQTALANTIAPRLADTPVAVDSFLSGQIAGLLNAGYNPDPNLLPAGAAVEVVEDDGSTDFATANALPVLTSATLDSPGSGDVTIAGTNMSGPGDPTAERVEVVVKFTGTGTPGGSGDALVLRQDVIEANGGTVTATSIVIPAVLNDQGGFVTTDTSAQVQYRSYATALVALS